MNRVISISPEGLRGEGKKLATDASELQDILKKLEQLIAQLQVDWQGDASVKYAKQFEVLTPSYKKAVESINSFSEAVIKTADNFEDLDAQIAQIMITGN